MASTTIVTRLDEASPPEDLGAFSNDSAFLDLCARTPTLHQIETDFAGEAEAPSTLRVGSWNVERCKHLAESARRLEQLDLDVILLSEMDDGMARSSNLNTTRSLAEMLGMTYAFAVEFIETGHGTDNERAQFAGQTNDRAFHGNAVLSRFSLSRLALLRLPGGEAWTSMDWHDARLGSRIALAGVIETRHGPLALASLHFESLPGPAERAGHMRRIVDFIDTSFPGLPVVMGGDLNSADLPEGLERDDASPEWFLQPDAFEPMFGAVREAGYAWAAANTAQHTRRQIATGRPFRPFKKVDWLFTRDVTAGMPVVYPATAGDGSPISDHEIIVAHIAMPTRLGNEPSRHE